MVKSSARGESARAFLLENVEAHPVDIVKVATERLGVSRQAVNRHLQQLVADGAVVREGNTRAARYRLAPIVTWQKDYALASLEEDLVWAVDIAPVLGPLPTNVRDLWNHAFSEMLNNAIDHSEGTRVGVRIEKTAARTEINIFDNGVGIFRKIQSAFGLIDERHAVLELAKGKLTTAPKRHSGEGIFFTSRMMDEFYVLSGGVFFTHDRTDRADWIWERQRTDHGTMVSMRLSNHTARTAKAVFAEYEGDDFAFTKTVVPVNLVRLGEDALVSRSQAKRLLARVDRFTVVVLDFAGVNAIGQAFSHEIFRVFANEHPGIELLWINACDDVMSMIHRAHNTR